MNFQLSFYCVQCTMEMCLFVYFLKRAYDIGIVTAVCIHISVFVFVKCTRTEKINLDFANENFAFVANSFLGVDGVQIFIIKSQIWRRMRIL